MRFGDVFSKYYPSQSEEILRFVIIISRLIVAAVVVVVVEDLVDHYNRNDITIVYNI